MNAYTTTKAAARILLLLLAVGLGACSGDEGGEASSPEAESAPGPGAESAPRPGPAGGPSESTTGETLDLRTVGYSRGEENAPVTVYEFSDFGCPFCAMFARGTYPGLHDEFVATGKVRWTYVPFVMGMFPNGEESARAAECAGEQEKFWEMHDLLYAQQNEWKASRDPARVYADYAGDLELNAGTFASCYREDRRGDRTEVNNRAADAMGVRATPSFLINGRLVEGALPAEEFRQLLILLSGSATNPGDAGPGGDPRP